MLEDLFFDKQGRPIDMRAFQRLHADMNYRVVKQEYVGPYWISTVWLGLDYQFQDGPPLIFETMVFARGPEDGGPEDDSLGLDMTCHRYSTEAEAEQGHFDMVTLINATYQPLEEVGHEREHGPEVSGCPPVLRGPEHPGGSGSTGDQPADG